MMLMTRAVATYMAWEAGINFVNMYPSWHWLLTAQLVTDEQCVASCRWQYRIIAIAAAYCSDCIGSFLQLLASVTDDQCLSANC